MASKSSKGAVVGLLFMFTGLISMAVALGFFIHSQNFVRNATQTTGTVIEMVERSSSEGNSTYAPVFTFTNSAGAAFTIHSRSASYPPKYRVGQSIPILYDPADPETAKTKDIFSLWGISLVCGAIGVIHFPLGLLLWLRSRSIV